MNESGSETQNETDDSVDRPSLWQTVKGDFAGATGLRLLGVIAVLIWMAFQWGWGNDILLPPIAASAFEALDDGDTWPSAAAATVGAAAAGGLFWMVTQTLDGIIVLSGLRLLPGVTQRISDFLRRQGWVKPFHEISRGTRFLIAYASGASILCLVDVFATGRLGLRSRKRMLAEAVALSTAGVAVLIAVVAALGSIGTRVPASKDTTDVLVRYAKNPLTWILIYATVILVSSALSRLRGKAPVDASAGEEGDSQG